jgi:hypothetical protein
MATLSKYEDSAQVFLEHHPVGSVVTADALLEWAAAYGDGFASDLLLDDPAKQLSAVRRHLNHGASSRNHAEDRRFYLNLVDAKRKTVQVEPLAQHVSRQAEVAFQKSITGAINPLKQTKKAIADLKLQELDDEQRQVLEEQVEYLTNSIPPLKAVLDAQTTSRMVSKLEAKGYPPEQAQHLIAAMPILLPFQKLLKATEI